MYTIEQLKLRKKELGITYEELSYRSVVPLRTLENIFNGITKHPRIDTMQAICRALGLTTEKNSSDELTDAEQELLTAFRALNGSMRAYVLQIVKSAVYAQEETAENKMTNNIKKIGG